MRKIGILLLVTVATAKRIKAGDTALYTHLAPFARMRIISQTPFAFPGFYQILVAGGDLHAIATVQCYARGKFTSAEQKAYDVDGRTYIRSKAVDLLTEIRKY